MEQNYVVQIATAMSNKPLYLRIADPNMSIDSIVNKAVAQLKEGGKTLDAQQLEAVYKSHQVFNGGKMVGKGDLFSNLTIQPTSLQDGTTVQLAELDLVSQHSGGL